MGSEVDLSPLFSQFPQKEWGIPRVLPGNRMAFHLYEPSKLIRHPYGMLEPDPGCPVISTEEVQLAFVPGLAFDLEGWRLGYGGGFYDRFLSGFTGNHAGITYQMLLAESIPHAHHDIPMQFLITENGIMDVLL
jgi:5-formyltetrahydrofolate cyclo-ligase